MNRKLESFMVYLLAGLGLLLGVLGLVHTAWLQAVVGTLLMVTAAVLDTKGFGYERT